MERVPVFVNEQTGSFADLTPQQQEQVKARFFDAHPGDGYLYSWSRRDKIVTHRYRPCS